MNTTSRIITGIALIVLGAALIIISFWAHYITLIYGIPLFIIGFFIMFNKKEDEIEKIKMKGGRR